MSPVPVSLVARRWRRWLVTVCRIEVLVTAVCRVAVCVCFEGERKAISLIQLIDESQFDLN